MTSSAINISKIERMIFVKDTIDLLKRATLEDVLSGFCSKTGLSKDTKNLKQYIRRDLESLCLDAHYLDKDYFLPNKDQIEPGEEKNYKNVRVEYFVIKENSNIIGSGILENANGRIITHNREFIDWKLSDLGSSFESDSVSFSMKLTKAGFISLSIKKEELPFKLIIGKASNNKAPSLQEISSTFGQRTTLMLLDEGGLEESIKNSKFGHCLIEFGRTTENCSVQDLISKNGTYISLPKLITQIEKPTSDKLFNEILYMADQNVSDIIILKPEPLTLDREWIKTEVTPSEHPLPLLVRCGRFVFYLSVI